MEEEIEEGPEIHAIAIVPPPAMGEIARENPRFSRTLGFTIQLDTVLSH